MGTLILQNSYSTRQWFNVPRSDTVIAIDEAYHLPSNSAWYIEWIPSTNDQEEGVIIGDKQQVERDYRSFEVALAKAYPNRYCPSRDEQYTVRVADNEVVYVG